MCETERLIEFVKERRFLYDFHNPDFKNRLKRLEAWQEIATEMGTGTANIWSSKWKGLKDNYAKYKKNSDPSFGQTYKKYKHWPWADLMKFLDTCHSSSRRIRCNHATNNTSENTSTSTLPETNACKFEMFIPDTNLPTMNELQDPIPDDSESFTSESKKRKIAPKSEVTEILDYLKTKIIDEKPSLDEVDHFFLSYAQSFKKLPNRMQIMLKLEIATLFSRYELQAEEINNDSVDSTPQIVHNPVKCEFDFNDTIEDEENALS